jgi:hypothetical protein
MGDDGGPLKMELVGSGGFCLMEDAITELVGRGYSTAEAESTVAEHHHFGRLQLTSSNKLLLLYAQSAFQEWVLQQRSSNPESEQSDRPQWDSEKTR